MFKQNVTNKKYYLEIRQGRNGSGDTVYSLQGYNKATKEKVFENFNNWKELLNWIKWACN